MFCCKSGTLGGIAFIGWVVIYVYVSWIAVGIILKREPYFSWLMIGLVAAVLSIVLMDQFQNDIYSREKWLVLGSFLGYMWDGYGKKRIDFQLVYFHVR